MFHVERRAESSLARGQSAYRVQGAQPRETPSLIPSTSTVSSTLSKNLCSTLTFLLTLKLALAYSPFMENTLTAATTSERISYLRRTIADRRRHADEFRALAIGNNVTDAKVALDTARDCDNVALGMERALLILFP